MNKNDIEKKFTESDITSLEDFEPKVRTGKTSMNLGQLMREIDEQEEVIDEIVKEEVLQDEGTLLEQEAINESKEPVIYFKNVGLEYDTEEILENINLKIYQGEFVYLVGESGAGKSSLIKMIYREAKNTRGEIFIDNEDITKFKNSQLPGLRRKVGVIFQDYKLLKDKTIFKNVSYSLEVTKYPKREIKDRVNYILKKVGIIEHADKYPNELSGGQQQRAAIARAIVDDPEFLVADEPTGNLDPENALAIMGILETINNEGTTVIMATHDVGIVNNFPKRVILIGNGKIIKETKGEYIYE